MKWIKYSIVTVLILVLSISVFLFIIYRQSLPEYSGQKQLQQLNESTKVVFDDYAVPHIYASNKEDAFRTLGYTHASERLFQMDLLRRVGGGRLSEIFGEDLKDVDVLFRTLGMKKIAKESAKQHFSTIDEEYKTLTLAYLDGINQFIREDRLPIEFTILGYDPEPFQPEDIYKTVAYMGFSFAMALKTDPIADYIKNELGDKYLSALALHTDSTNILIPVHRPDSSLKAEQVTQMIQKVMETLPAPEFSGSNSWVIGAKKTKSGKVLFANDTHIGYSQPAIWYEAHISTPDLQLYGNFLAGFPFPLVGHTLHHSWGLTMLENDDFDLYRETIKDDKVLYKGKWQPLEHSKETIHIKGKDSITIDIASTPHGPLIHQALDQFSDEQPISAYWTLTRFPLDVLRSGYGLFTAQNVTEFEEYISTLTAPGLNIMYGDVEDNIAWWGAAKLIKRPAHVNSKLILDGSSGKDDPLGFYDFSENSKSINPESGYVYSANNQPASWDSVLYPGYYYPGNRAKVIMTAIEQSNDWTIEQLKQLQLNNTSPNYHEMAREILQHVVPETDIEKEAHSLLQQWDGHHNYRSVEPTIYYKLLYHVLALSLEDELGQENFETYLKSYFVMRSNPVLIFDNQSPWWDNISTDKKESRKEIFQQAFQKSIQQLFVQLGEHPKNWYWEKVHQVAHEHPLGKVQPLDKLFNVGPIPIDGGEEVVNKQSFTINEIGYYKVTGGPAMRIVIDFADVEHSESVLPTGQSGNPFSDYFDNQALMFAHGKYRLQKMNQQEIEKSSIGTVLFEPVK